ncbi:PQQ-dependent sugar dehydrogenase [Spirosoma endophyticum]|uniref:Glucose/arabinose dehydrogenase, beta-propeller fold n=1 Tax=Spirosoma endophyticum TaxID=662367 RepID=A0A1I2H9A7_9BACT|nr:PQQ-dependent sugar dehydrogenase [Spirosoma endophyticum]SFF26148.1 Glucose/arabinose dehydrogenase, beta-propeller fold [Spirosoma endophyticum]
MNRFTRSQCLLSNRLGSVLVSLCVCCLVFFDGQTVFAQTFPTNFTQVAVATGLTAPTVAMAAPDGRIFVALQSGSLRVVKNGTLLPTPFVQLNVNSSGERGLLGIAFDPAFATNQYIYLYYTVPTSGTITVHNRISRFTANGDVAVAGSETIILELNPLSSATNHNGGTIVFGPDQKLYVGVGENANSANSQNLDTYLGKVLRINPDGSAPSDNPFPTADSEAKKRVWSYGLRNPYTLTFQPTTGRLFVNDVGENTWEEINDATTGGLNFGWPSAEGTSSNAGYTNPVYAYHHGSGDGFGCAITGGAFYNPTLSRYPASFTGKYFYQDYCNNWINVLDLSGSVAVRSTFATGLPGNSLGLTLGTDGYLYYLSKSSASLYRIEYTGPDLATILYAQPSSVNGTSPVSLVVNVFELNVVPTSGPIKVYVTKDPLLTLTFDPSATSLGNRPVQNGLWQFDGVSNATAYVLTTTQTTGTSGKLSVGLSGQLTPGNTKGNLNISVVVEGSGVGEVKLTNNADAERIEYFNK